MEEGDQDDQNQWEYFKAKALVATVVLDMTMATAVFYYFVFFYHKSIAPGAQSLQ